MAISQRSSKKPLGRPPKDKKAVIIEVTDLAIAHASAGGFWGTLRAHIYKQNKNTYSEWYLNKIADEHEDFAQTKKLCFSLCSEYWDKQSDMGNCSDTKWIFIKKNIDGWRDRIDQKTLDVKAPVVGEKHDELIEEFKSILECE